MTHARIRQGLLLAAVTAVLAGCGSPQQAPAVAPAAAPAAPVAHTPAPSEQAAAPVAALAPAEPVNLAVSAIGVDTGPLLALGIDPEGALEVPPDALTAGWFTLGPTPGATGPAVIAAHVDYAGVPGVFSRLHELAPGDEVRVRRADGTEAVFATYRVDRYAKADFPTERVYGDTDGPELRLITCGGAFDRGTGQYADNVVAYARLVAA
ncbi:class F sortase [Pseudonocardia nigra]|uniref:class F sortase n=1 Tax=Pseudonocardia nigra TaxID=1921578 RepID=UPI001C5DAF0A|nr:class F sortase [Pseudonocardia nigra]